MSQNESKKPTHKVFVTIENPSRDEDAKDQWIQIGVGWLNSDKSVSCILTCWPLAWGAGYRGKFKIVVQENRDQVRDSDDRQRHDNRSRERR